MRFVHENADWIPSRHGMWKEEELTAAFVADTRKWQRLRALPHGAAEEKQVGRMTTQGTKLTPGRCVAKGAPRKLYVPELP
jgi:hypothetical protein